MPSPSQENEDSLDFSAFIHTSTPFYATQIPPPPEPTPAIIPQQLWQTQNEVLMLSTQPFFVDSSNERFATEHAADADVPASLELDHGVDSVMFVAEGEEVTDLPSLPLQREEQVRGSATLVGIGEKEIPDSDAVSELSSPVKSVDGDEEATGIEDFGESVTEETILIDRRNGMDVVERSELNSEGMEEEGGLVDRSFDEDEGDAVRVNSTLDRILDGKEGTVINTGNAVQTTSGEQAKEVTVDGEIETFTREVSASSEGGHDLHITTPYLEGCLDEFAHTTALQKVQVDALSALHAESSSTVIAPPNGNGVLRKSYMTEESRPFPGGAVEDFGGSKEETPSEKREVAHCTAEEVSQDASEDMSTPVSPTAILEQFSTEMEDVQSTQGVSTEDEVSMVPPGDVSRTKETLVEKKAESNEPEDVIMEDVPPQEIGKCVEKTLPAINPAEAEIPVPRASRRHSSRNSGTSSAAPSAPPKQSRRASGRGKSQLGATVEVPAPQRATESTAITPNNLEVLEEAHPSSASQVPDLADGTKSQRGTKTETGTEALLTHQYKIETPPGRSNGITKDNTTTTPVLEVTAEVPSRKKSQRKISSRKPISTSPKRQFEDEPEESKNSGNTHIADSSTPSLPILFVPASEPPQPAKPTALQRTPLAGREGSQSKAVLMAELKAIKIASIQARNASLEIEIANKRAKLEEVTKDLTQPAAETVKRHIKLLHDYNDIRDVGQALVGMIADNRGVRIGELYEEFGVGLKD